jgi:hypothetical protein
VGNFLQGPLKISEESRSALLVAPGVFERQCAAKAVSPPPQLARK